MRSPWPEGFRRIPDEDWANEPVDELARSYDRVRRHGWYANLDPVVDDLVADLRDGDLLLDYSGGTGILVDRLRGRVGDRAIGMLVVDASPKFLRFALEHLGDDGRVAFRLLRFLRDERRVQLLREALDPVLLDRGVDAISCTNAIHLYPDLDAVVTSWHDVLRDQRHAFINSGNILDAGAASDEWIIDRTVAALNDAARRIVREDPRFAAFRDVLEDDERMRAHAEFRDRVFLPPRPVGLYLSALERGGFDIEDVRARTISADVREWYEFLLTYEDAVLGWIGGTEKLEGRAPTADALQARHDLLRRSLHELFGGQPTFPCRWTFIRARAR